LTTSKTVVQTHVNGQIIAVHRENKSVWFLVCYTQIT